MESKSLKIYITTLVTLLVPSFCYSPNALGYAIFNDDHTGEHYNKSLRTINKIPRISKLTTIDY